MKARLMTAGAVLCFIAAAVMAAASGAEVEFVRSAAFMWLGAMPLMLLGAALLLGAAD